MTGPDLVIYCELATFVVGVGVRLRQDGCSLDLRSTCTERRQEEVLGGENTRYERQAVGCGEHRVDRGKAARPQMDKTQLGFLRNRKWTADGRVSQSREYLRHSRPVTLSTIITCFRSTKLAQQQAGTRFSAMPSSPAGGSVFPVPKSVQSATAHGFRLGTDVAHPPASNLQKPPYPATARTEYPLPGRSLSAARLSTPVIGPHRSIVI